ncbi:MAG: type II secretion system F family protein, partial [Candidatus Wildermuthbacteria bacterium]|nr:type II secretion system F family protein [Candidatus Wildermuthbacteria bacterium]
MKFRYQARDKQGKTQIGVIGASSKEAALRLLEGYGLFITLLEAEHEQLLLARDIEWFNRVSLKDVLIFSRELAIMFKARVPLLEALAVLAHQMKNKSFKERASDIAEAVEGGTSLSAALAKHPGIFSSFFVSMVRSGEASGKLAEALEYLADHLEREHEVNRKVVAAMVYPAFVVGVTLIILLMIAYVVVPNFLSVLAANNQQMPLITKVVVALAMGLRQWGLLIALALAAAAIGLARYCKTKEGKALWDALLLRIPLLGPLLRMVYVARFAEDLSTLITGGLPITRALDIVNDVVENTVYRRII